ncbi:MAG: PLDc N-terminal domain-containing protein [Alphaproteobacteria bacterium]
MLSGIFGLIVLILDIWAIVKILQSGAETLSKVIWILIILVLPILGFIIWYFAGPRGNAPAS